LTNFLFSSLYEGVVVVNRGNKRNSVRQRKWRGGVGEGEGRDREQEKNDRVIVVIFVDKYSMTVH